MATYNYRRFRLPYKEFTTPELLAVGDRLSGREVTALDGGRVTIGGSNERIQVIETGSISCPQFVNWIEDMGRLQKDYEDVEFYVRYVREAHPGGGTPEHASFDQKRAQAQRIVAEEGERRRVLVDELEGSIHHELGLVPNSVKIIDTSGVVRYSAAWAEPAELRTALDQVRAGEQPQAASGHFPQAKVSTVLRVLRRAGARALVDFVRMIPAMRHSHKVESAPRRQDVRWRRRGRSSTSGR